MIDTGATKKPVVVASLQEFFHEALHSAISHQKLAVRDQTEHYVVNVLTLFSRSEALYEETAEGVRLKPLVVMLTEALEAPTAAERQRGLQRLGDVALFIAGFFAGSFARRLIDIDYHIAMGGRAYGSLADTVGRRRPVLGGVFGELADKFQGMVDALNEVSEMAHEHNDRDVLRLYEIWMKTGSPRARELLRKLGIEPSPCAATRLQH